MIQELKLNSFYQEDLAYIHHAGFGEFARQAGQQVLRMLRDVDDDPGLVVDLGCGSGIWASMLTDAGYDVAGIDISPYMIDLARQEAPLAELHQGSAFDFNIPKCQSVTALGEVLGYASPELPTDERLAGLFTRVAGQPGRKRSLRF